MRPTVHREVRFATHHRPSRINKFGCLACYKEWVARRKEWRDVISVLFLRPISPACIVLSVTLTNQIRKEHKTSYRNWAIRVYTFSQNSLDSWRSMMSDQKPGKLVDRHKIFPSIFYTKRLFGSRKYKLKDNIKMYLVEVGFLKKWSEISRVKLQTIKGDTAVDRMFPRCKEHKIR
jgi:hypothetical protein